MEPQDIKDVNASNHLCIVTDAISHIAEVQNKADFMMPDPSCKKWYPLQQS